VEEISNSGVVFVSPVVSSWKSIVSASVTPVAVLCCLQSIGPSRSPLDSCKFHQHLPSIPHCCSLRLHQFDVCIADSPPLDWRWQQNMTGRVCLTRPCLSNPFSNEFPNGFWSACMSHRMYLAFSFKTPNFLSGSTMV